MPIFKHFYIGDKKIWVKISEKRNADDAFLKLNQDLTHIVIRKLAKTF